MTDLKTNKQTVRLKLTLEKEFYELLCSKAKSDYSKVATWTRQFLMRELMSDNNTYSKCSTQNESIM